MHLRVRAPISFTPDPAPILALQEKFAAEWTDYKADLQDFLYDENDEKTKTLNEATGAFSPSVLLKTYVCNDYETEEIIQQIELKFTEAKTALEKYQAARKKVWTKIKVTDTDKIFYESQLLVLDYYRIEIINQFIKKILIKNDKKITEGATLLEGPRVGQKKADEFADGKDGNRPHDDPLTPDQSREIATFLREKKETITSIDQSIKEFNRQFNEFEKIQADLDLSFDGLDTTKKASLLWRKELAFAYLYFLGEEHSRIGRQLREFYRARKTFSVRVATIAALPALSGDDIDEIKHKQIEIQFIRNRKAELDSYCEYFRVNHAKLKEYYNLHHQQELPCKITYLENQNKIIDSWTFGKEPARQKILKTADARTLTEDEKSTAGLFPEESVFQKDFDAEQENLTQVIAARENRLKLYKASVQGGFKDRIYEHRADHIDSVVTREITENLRSFPYDVNSYRTKLDAERAKLKPVESDAKNEDYFSPELARILPGPDKAPDPSKGAIAVNAFWLARQNCSPPIQQPEPTLWQTIYNDPIAKMIFWGVVGGAVVTGLCAASILCLGMDIPLILGILSIAGGAAVGALLKGIQMYISDACCGGADDSNDAPRYVLQPIRGPESRPRGSPHSSSHSALAAPLTTRSPAPSRSSTAPAPPPPPPPLDPNFNLPRSFSESQQILLSYPTFPPTTGGPPSTNTNTNQLDHR